MGAKFRQPPFSVAEANIISKSITANGTYNASSDNADGYNPVVVDVPGEHATIVSKSITANGTYNASADNADGYDPVVVAVPEPVIKSKSITANGTYNASSDNADGFDPVVVNVPGSTIVSKSITANGTYNASVDNADGYNPVVVAVPEPVIISKSITANGTYNASSDNADGFDPVVVNVPGSTIVSKSITANGTYNASSDSADGYNPVTVNVQPVDTALWTNSAPTSDFLSQNITLNDSIDNYDDIVFKYKGSTTSSDIRTIVVSVADLKNSTTVTAIDKPYVGLTMRLSNGLYHTRLVAYISVTELSISSSYQLYGAVQSTSYAIPTQVLGRKY